MTQPPDWIVNTPSTDAIHTQPAKAGGEFTTPFSPATLFQIGEKLLEGFLARVVQALVGVFIPGGNGAAFAQLQGWATKIVGIVPATIKLFTDILTLNWLAIPADLLSLAGLGVDGTELSAALSQSVTSAPTVTFDASSYGSVNTGNPTSYTKPHTTGPGANMGMTVHVAIGPLTPKAYVKGFATVTYNGVALESKGGIDSGHGTNGWLELFTLNGAAGGLHDVVVTTTAPVHSIAASINTYAGCGGFSGFVSGATNAELQSLAVRGTTGGMVVVGMAAGNSISGASAGTQRTAENVDNLTNAGNLIVADAPGADSVTVAAGGSPAQVLVDLTASVTATGLSVNVGLAATVTASGQTMAGFVTRDPATGYLMLAGQRYRFAGNNGEMAGLSESTTTYGETVTSGLHTMNHAAIDDYFVAAQAMSARVVRQWLLTMGTPNSLMPTMNTYNDPAFDGFDYALTKCSAAGIKVIFTLVDDYDYYTGGKFDWCTLSGVTPDGNASQFFTNATVIANFKAFVSHLLNHVNTYTGVAYKDDPSILAWETGNELQIGGTPQSLLDWTADIANHIKNTVGAQQLVMDGKWGLLGPSSVIPAAHMADPNIDIYTEHTYDQYRTPAHMANQAAIAHNYGKAFIVGEYPLAGASGWTNADMIAANEGNANVDGDLFWSLHPQGNFHGGGFCTHYPGDDGTMISRVTAQKNHAIAMSGPTLTAATAPAKAETLVGPDVDASKWTARSTANISGGQIILPTGDTAYSSAVKYDLTKSSVIVEMVTKNPGTGASACGMFVQPTQAPYSGNTIGFIPVGNTMNFRYDVGGNSDTSETYNSTNHRWLRLRASADASYLTAYPAAIGTLYWDTSADGVTWVNKRSYSGPAMVLTSVYVVLYNHNYGGDGSSGTAVFDNFNN